MTEHIKNEHFPELTQKQFVILELYATGLPTKLIQQKLDISASSVTEHMNAIKTKLGCAYTNEMRQVYLSRLMLAVYNKLI